MIYISDYIWIYIFINIDIDIPDYNGYYILIVGKLIQRRD